MLLQFLYNCHGIALQLTLTYAAAGAVFRSSKCPIFVEGTDKGEVLERLGVLLRVSVMNGLKLIA